MTTMRVVQVSRPNGPFEIADGQDTGDAPMLLHQGVKIDASLKPFHSLSPLPPGAACPSSALSAARVVQSFLSEHIEYQQ
jgi:hypothetical protein